MSFASFSTRDESSPARTSDVGLHVDSARRTISSPDCTVSTGLPAASYQPHATVFGVGINVYVRPGAGAGQCTRIACPDVGATNTDVFADALPVSEGVPAGTADGDPETEDGAPHPSAVTPPSIVQTSIARAFMSLLLRRPPPWAR